MTRLVALAASLLVVLAGSAAGAASPPPPSNTLPPAIAGTAIEGQTLTVSTGTWTGTGGPITYTYQWYRCGYAGSPCVILDTAMSATYLLASADVGRTLRATVTAKDTNGSNAATAAPTATVAALNPPPATAAAEELPTAILIEHVVEPNGIVLDEIKLVPSSLRSRNAFKVRVHVADTAKLDVVGALVSVDGVPYGAVGTVASRFTGDDGWAQLSVKPTRFLKLKPGGLALVVRAAAAGQEVVTGPSASKVVHVKLVAPKQASAKRS